MSSHTPLANVLSLFILSCQNQQSDFRVMTPTCTHFSDCQKLVIVPCAVPVPSVFNVVVICLSIACPSLTQTVTDFSPSSTLYEISANPTVTAVLN